MHNGKDSENLQLEIKRLKARIDGLERGNRRLQMTNKQLEGQKNTYRRVLLLNAIGAMIFIVLVLLIR